MVETIWTAFLIDPHVWVRILSGGWLISAILLLFVIIWSTLFLNFLWKIELYGSPSRWYLYYKKITNSYWFLIPLLVILYIAFCWAIIAQ